MSRQLLRSLRPLEGPSRLRPSPPRPLLAAPTSFVSRPSPPLPAVGQLRSIRTLAAFSSSIASTPLANSLAIPRPVPIASGRLLPSASLSRRAQSSSSQQQNQSSPPEEETDDESPDKLPLTQRIKALSKKYGWWAVGVYTVLSLFDFGIAFALVQYLGMDRVQRLERSLKLWVRETTGWSWGEEPVVLDLKDTAQQGQQEIKRKGYDSSFWAQVAIAYGIHKTVFLPFRIGATTAILPKLVKFMTKHGWAGRGAKGVKEKVQQVVKDRTA